jgi:hypothetical protein
LLLPVRSFLLKHTVVQQQVPLACLFPLLLLLVQLLALVL